eukprot:c5487_g1_i2.p1 GENE.c5487_g1_i2~~c5487_g1_i2.p1  ORF type:complete len:147 (-),score=31.95 c5487_g1_i2:148-564(-)
MSTTKVQKVMVQPMKVIFKFLQNESRVQIMLFEQNDIRIEGRIIGFDEYMNFVLDDAEEINLKKKSSTKLGECLSLTVSFTNTHTHLHVSSSSTFMPPSNNPNQNSPNRCTNQTHINSGRILLKGDNISLMFDASKQQ